MVLYYSNECESSVDPRPWSVQPMYPSFPSRPTRSMKGTERRADGPMGGVALVAALPLCTWDPRWPNWSPSKLALVASPAAPDFCSGRRPSEGSAQSGRATAEHPL